MSLPTSTMAAGAAGTEVDHPAGTRVASGEVVVDADGPLAAYLRSLAADDTDDTDDNGSRGGTAESEDRSVRGVASADVDAAATAAQEPEVPCFRVSDLVTHVRSAVSSADAAPAGTTAVSALASLLALCHDALNSDAFHRATAARARSDVASSVLAVGELLDQLLAGAPPHRAGDQAPSGALSSDGAGHTATGHAESSSAGSKDRRPNDDVAGREAPTRATASTVAYADLSSTLAAATPACLALALAFSQGRGGSSIRGLTLRPVGGASVAIAGTLALAAAAWIMWRSPPVLQDSPSVSAADRARTRETAAREGHGETDGGVERVHSFDTLLEALQRVDAVLRTAEAAVQSAVHTTSRAEAVARGFGPSAPTSAIARVEANALAASDADADAGAGAGAGRAARTAAASVRDDRGRSHGPPHECGELRAAAAQCALSSVAIVMWCAEALPPAADDVIMEGEECAADVLLADGKTVASVSHIDFVELHGCLDDGPDEPEVVGSAPGPDGGWNMLALTPSDLLLQSLRDQLACIKRYHDIAALKVVEGVCDLALASVVVSARGAIANPTIVDKRIAALTRILVIAATAMEAVVRNFRDNVASRDADAVRGAVDASGDTAVSSDDSRSRGYQVRLVAHHGGSLLQSVASLREHVDAVSAHLVRVQGHTRRLLRDVAAGDVPLTAQWNEVGTMLRQAHDAWVDAVNAASPTETVGAKGLTTASSDRTDPPRPSLWAAALSHAGVLEAPTAHRDGDMALKRAAPVRRRTVTRGAGAATAAGSSGVFEAGDGRGHSKDTDAGAPTSDGGAVTTVFTLELDDDRASGDGKADDGDDGDAGGRADEDISVMAPTFSLSELTTRLAQQRGSDTEVVRGVRYEEHAYGDESSSDGEQLGAESRRVGGVMAELRSVLTHRGGDAAS